jgi:hypothetical protein
MTGGNLRRIFAAIALIASGAVLPSGVEAVTIVDLSEGNTSGTINGALFTTPNQQPTGTGVIDPFLRLQGRGTEQGFNTSGGTPFDDKAGIWTHDITFADLSASLTTVNGVQYYQILLDVNEPTGKKSLISLDQLQFYTSPIASQTTTNVSSLGVLRYTFNPGDYVLLDAALNSGSGSGDMYAYIPAANFAGALSTDYIYMYTAFGFHASADYTTDGGFEEWALNKNQSEPPDAGRPVPESISMWMSGGILGVLCGIDFRRRRTRKSY